MALPIVLGHDAHFTADDRSAETDVVLHRVAAEPGVALGQAHLVGKIPAEQGELPMRSHHGIDARVQVVIRGQRRQVRVVLVAYADPLERHLLGHGAPVERLRVARRQSELIARQTRKLFAVDRAADGLIVYVGIQEAALEVLVVGVFPVAVERDPEGSQDLDIAVRERA